MDDVFALPYGATHIPPAATAAVAAIPGAAVGAVDEGEWVELDG